MADESSYRLALGLTLVAGLLWGTSFVVINLGLRYIDPFRFVFLRFLVAAAVMLLVAYFNDSRGMDLFKSPTILLLGVINAMGFALQFVGQVYTTASNAALLVNLTALIVPVASWLVLKEKFPPFKIAAVAVGLAGVVLLTTKGSFGTSESHYLGDGLNAASAFAWSGFAILNKKTIMRHRNQITSVTAAMLTFTFISLVPVGILSIDFTGFQIGWQAWAAILYTGVLCTVAPFILLNTGLKTLSPTVSTLTLLIEIITASALASVILGETFNVPSGFGALLIVLAMVLASR